MAQMLAPIGGRNLVFNQRINGVRVRNTQQGFRKAHKRDALVSGKAIFRKKAFHQTRVIHVANVCDERGRIFADPRAILHAEIGYICQCVHPLSLIREGLRVDFGVIWDIEGHGPISCAGISLTL